MRVFYCILEYRGVTNRGGRSIHFYRIHMGWVLRTTAMRNSRGVSGNVWIMNSKPNVIGKSKVAQETRAPPLGVLSISCSFKENLAKSYVGTPPWGGILDPPLNGDNYLWGCLNMVHQYIVFRNTVMYYAPYFSNTLDGAMESYIILRHRIIITFRGNM